MKKYIFLVTILCILSNVAYSMGLQDLDPTSKSCLLAYARRKSVTDNYWPTDATVTLIKFDHVNEADRKDEPELEYAVRFLGRYTTEVTLPDGTKYMQPQGRYRSAFMSVATLRNIGVTLPEAKR